MNELQRVEFDILKQFVKLCDELNLTYYLVCGSALGAVKYNGFIPWDDDIDVGMPREDYEKFLKTAPDKLSDKYFLQNYLTDPKFPAIYSKLRNSCTTYIEKTSAKLDINHGVFIDIFPLDGYPSSYFRKKVFEFSKKIYSRLLSSAFDADRHGLSLVINKALRLLGFHKRTDKTAAKYSKMISSYPIKNSKLICNHGNWQGKLEYTPLEQYGKGTYADFEGLRVRIPEKYDLYLKQKYGDWKAELPEDEQFGHHYYKIVDLQKSYAEYIPLNRVDIK